ncbi:MAG: LamG domain-containing protein [Oligoflexales bacterium]|nr:LamG domain-containing protein [Oligoflexales bacterium]
MPRFKIRQNAYSIKVNGGNSDCILCANSSTLNPTSAVTLEMWIKPESYKASVLFDNSQSGATNSYFVLLSATGGLSFYGTIGGSSTVIASTAKKVKMNEWNFLNISYNGSAILFFLNGDQLADTASVSGSLGTNTGQLRIGRYVSLTGNLSFDGFLYRPRIYSRGFTLAEHQSRFFYDTDDSTINTGLVLDLAMTEGAGSTIADISGRNNNGTLSTSTWSTEGRFKNRTLIS